MADISSLNSQYSRYTISLWARQIKYLLNIMQHDRLVDFKSMSISLTLENWVHPTFILIIFFIYLIFFHTFL